MSLLDAIQQKKNKLQTTETKESAVHLGTKDDEEKLQSYIHRFVNLNFCLKCIE